MIGQEDLMCCFLPRCMECRRGLAMRILSVLFFQYIGIGRGRTSIMFSLVVGRKHLLQYNA